MARNVFNTEAPESDEVPISDRRPAAKRRSLVSAGPVSSKYIGSAAQGAADRTYQELSVDQIQDSQIQDRIDVREDIETLIKSIRDRGQQIPIIVRLSQGNVPYEIVVGRRRLAAIRELGQATIKAFVTQMDDQEAFITQGIENNERLETSFIERARAADQATKAGYSHDDISQFLGVSRPLITMMTRIYKSIGDPIVVAIGPARGVGRRKWEALSEFIASTGMSEDQITGLVDTSLESAERFEALVDHLRSGLKQPKPARRKPVETSKRSFLNGSMHSTRKPRELVVKLDHTVDEDLLDEIEGQIEGIVTRWSEKEEI